MRIGEKFIFLVAILFVVSTVSAQVVLQETILLAGDAADREQFGVAVDVEGNTAVIGPDSTTI